MSGYHPPQREIRAAVLTGARWIAGTFHLPKLHAFDDYLCRRRPFFTLTDVELGGATPHPFLALRGSAAQAIAPAVPVSALLLPEAADARPRDVTCYLERCVIRGSVDLRPDVRTSDFLAHREGFITLRCCRVVPPVPGRPEPLPVVFVNANAIYAVGEEEIRMREALPVAPPGAPLTAASELEIPVLARRADPRRSIASSR